MQTTQRMAAELAAETTMTRSLLARIPDDKLAWTPADGLHSIAWNASHLVEIVAWTPGILSQSEFDIAPEGGEPYVTPQATRTAEVLDAFDRHRADALAALQTAADPTLDEPWSLKAGGQTLFTMKKGECLRKWVFSHSAHHRGILSAYLRMAGVQFPSIYEE